MSRARRSPFPLVLNFSPSFFCCSIHTATCLLIIMSSSVSRSQSSEQVEHLVDPISLFRARTGLYAVFFIYEGARLFHRTPTTTHASEGMGMDEPMMSKAGTGPTEEA
jgi:hypothetical protein